MCIRQVGGRSLKKCEQSYKVTSQFHQNSHRGLFRAHLGFRTFTCDEISQVLMVDWYYVLNRYGGMRLQDVTCTPPVRQQCKLETPCVAGVSMNRSKTYNHVCC